MTPPDRFSRNCSDKEPGHCSAPGINPRAVQYLTVLLFVTASSLLFLCLFEWDRYRIIIGPRWLNMSILDKALIFWLLLGKSMAWFVALLPVAGLLIALRFTRTATVIVNLFCTCALVLMASDLVSVGFAGYHIWDYLPNIRDILENPGLNIWQWAGDGLTAEALFLIAMFATAAVACFMCVRWVAVRFAGRFGWVCSRKTLAMLTCVVICVPIGVVPAIQFFHDQNLLDRIYATLPPTPGLRESCQRLTDGVAPRIGERHSVVGIRESLEGRRLGAVDAAESRALWATDLRGDFDLLGLPRNARAGWTSEAGRMASPWGHWPAVITEMMKPLIDLSTRGLRESWYPNPIRHHAEFSGRLEADRGEQDHPEGRSATVDLHDELTALRVLRDTADPGPADSSAFVERPELPNVILIIFESFRHSALGPELMRDLDAWADQGLRLRRHYSGSNCSHLGLFSLFYGRSPLGYHQTLDRKIPAQMLESLRRSGYRITFLTSGETKGFRRLDQFINAQSCDNVIEEGEFTLKGMADWPDSDRRKLDTLRTIVNNPQGQPQFVFFYLVSSHYRYPFPPEFAIYRESPSFLRFLNPRAQIRNHLNRYANSVLFLEHEVMKLVRSIDLKRNIVMITGDHGESMGEDGVFTHGSRMSEIQMRVPFVMVGPGVDRRSIPTATVHADALPTLLHALAGTRVPINNVGGRDLIADPSPADEVVLVPSNGPDWEGFMIVRGNRRMAFRTNTKSENPPWVEFTGLIDESGQYVVRAVKGGRNGPDLTTNR